MSKKVQTDKKDPSSDEILFEDQVPDKLVGFLTAAVFDNDDLEEHIRWAVDRYAGDMGWAKPKQMSSAIYNILDGWMIAKHTELRKLMPKVIALAEKKIKNG